MKIKFWGVRGSIPTPLTVEQLKSRIAAIVMRIKPRDLETPETRDAFLAGLPPYLFGTVGGNTTCAEIRTARNKLIIIDAGSGIRELAHSLVRRQEQIKDFYLFFTHFHWDHIQGLPFFIPAGYTPGNSITFYSPREDLEAIIKGQMRSPYFPVGMEAMRADMHFRQLTGGSLKVQGIQVRWREMKHPGGCTAYKFIEGDKSLIFATDSEITPEDFKKTEANEAFFRNADLLVLDSQYTLGEAIEKYNWGHTSYSMAIDFAAEWGIKTLVLFHHEPLYNDRKINGILNSAEWYRARLENKRFRVMLAVEGMEIDV
jgi:phosphoribosyl 1,2-cyclic phosphodiesterase